MRCIVFAKGHPNSKRNGLTGEQAHEENANFFLFKIIGVLKIHILFRKGALVLTNFISFCSYPKVAISEHFTVNQAQTLIEAQSLI
jgi:hypothetical protein